MQSAYALVIYSHRQPSIKPGTGRPSHTSTTPVAVTNQTMQPGSQTLAPQLTIPQYTCDVASGNHVSWENLVADYRYEWSSKSGLLLAASDGSIRRHVSAFPHISIRLTLPSCSPHRPSLENFTMPFETTPMDNLPQFDRLPFAWIGPHRLIACQLHIMRQSK